MSGQSAAGWHPDPQGRHQLRYWDGQQWTDDVSDNGVVSKDGGAAQPPVDPNATYAGGVLPPVPQAGGTPPPAQPRPAGADPMDQASTFLSNLPETALLGVCAGLTVILGFFFTLVLSTILSLDPDNVFFTGRFVDGGKRLFGGLIFGAILGAAIVGGRALVDAVKMKAFDTALMPLAKGAAAGAAAGFVLQLIGFRILDEFVDAVGGDIPDPIFLAIYFAVEWAIFGAVVGAVSLAPIGGPDPNAKQRLIYLPIAGAIGGLVFGFVVAILFDGLFDIGLFAALLEMVLVAGLLGAAGAAAASGTDVMSMLPGQVGGGGGGAAPAAPFPPAQPAQPAPPAAPVAPQPAPQPAPQQPQAAGGQPEGWYPDPSGRHQTRWWDGQQWTSHVADNGVRGTDNG